MYSDSTMITPLPTTGRTSLLSLSLPLLSLFFLYSQKLERMIYELAMKNLLQRGKTHRMRMPAPTYSHMF